MQEDGKYGEKTCLLIQMAFAYETLCWD